MKKRIVLVILLVLSITGGLFAAGQTEKTSGSVDAMDKKYTITVYHGSPQGRIDESKDDILKVLNEKLNIDLKINIITSDYTSKLNLEVSSGNAPDIMSVSQEQFNSLLNQGILLPIEDYVTRMPNFMARYPNVLEDKTLRVDGHLYFLAGTSPSDQVVKAFASLWVRKDWLEKLGLEIPKTLEDFKNVAIAFATKDPDGNGINDTFGFTGLGARVTNGDSMYALNPILGAFGVGELNYQIMNGKLVYSATTPEYKQAITWMRDFIATGAVDPDIMLLNSYDQIREKVYRNQVGMIYMTWAEFIKPPYDQIMQEMIPDAQWIQIAPPIGPNGDQYDSVYSIPGFKSSGKVLSADLADDPDKLDRVLEYLDYICYGEGLELVCYGIEGDHYNKVDGNIIPTDRVGEVSYAWQHQVMGRIEKVYLYTKFIKISDSIDFAADLPRIDCYNNFITIPEGANKADLLRYVEEETVRFLYGKRNLNEFDQYVETLNKTYSLQKYLDNGTKTLRDAGILK